MKILGSRTFILTTVPVLLCSMPNRSLAQDNHGQFDYRVFPAAGRLAGIGFFYDPDGDLRNVASTTFDIVGGQSADEIEAAGAGTAGWNPFKGKVVLGAGLARVDRPRLDISHTRGMDEDAPVTQKSDATAAEAVWHWRMFESPATLNTHPGRLEF